LFFCAKTIATIIVSVQERIMTVSPLFGRVYEALTTHRYYLVSLIAIFFLIEIGFFIAWPIVGYDTDLWYHLSGGRYFWENGATARDAYFSFISPPKVWYDYYWMFQAIVYKVFQWTGYPGLVTLRCLLYALTSLMIVLFFIRHDETPKRLLVGLSFFICYPIALITREMLVRPHLFSYLFIVVFLYILEFKRDKIWLLPLLGIFWVNIHGIEYPVMILIVLAYLAEMYYRDLRGKSPQREGDKFKKWFLIMTPYTVFFTPQVIELIKTPFNIAYNNALYQQFYVLELLPVDIRNVLSLSALPVSNLIPAAQHLLILVAVASFLICLGKRSLRISHLIIFLCASVLLIKYYRFIFEFILLSIPLICHGLAIKIKTSEKRGGFFTRAAPVLMIVILIAVPAVVYGSKFMHRPEYPLSQANLPMGVAGFLNKLDAGGSVLNEPNTGGYLQWALDHKYKIYMDLQLAIFNDRDFAYGTNALYNENTFRSFARKYDPSFLSVSLNRSHFTDLIAKFPEYRLIFFDDTETLYVNARHFPGIAEAHELKCIDPFRQKSSDYGRETPEQRSQIYREAMRLRSFYPDCRITNSILFNLLLVNKDYEKAIPYAEVIIHRYPDIADGYALKADALFALDRFEQAAVLYRKAIELRPKETVGNGYRNLHVCYIRLKEYRKAYRLISEYINPFDLTSTYKDLYALAMSAAAAGKIRDAVNFLKIAEMKLPPDDAEYMKKIKENLLMLDAEGKRANEQ
jgi:tetratricopeptide (TPR) repeat protein